MMISNRIFTPDLPAPPATLSHPIRHALLQVLCMFGLGLGGVSAMDNELVSEYLRQ